MPQKIVIVGGVAAGMSCATRLRRLSSSATITVFESGPFTGFANCGIPYALGGAIASDASLVLRTPADFKARFDVDVSLGCEVVAIDAEAHVVTVRNEDNGSECRVPYDKLVLAQGAEAFRPGIPGVELRHVVTMQTLPDLQRVRSLMAEREVRRVCVVGAGFIGVEVAENLRDLGLQVSVVEVGPHVFPPVDSDIAEVLQAEMRRHGVQLFLGTAAARIDEQTVFLSDGRQVPADLVVMAAGVRARTQLAQQAGLALGRTGVQVNAHMQTSNPDIYAVGDMAETQNTITHSPAVLALAGPANRQGRLVADHICGRDVRFRGHVAAAVCKVFDLTVGTVGLSVSALKRAGMQDVCWTTVHPPDHAGYYPGSKPMTLKLVYSHPAGRILGAQLVGPKGVDKRLDVLSTAMQAGMTVFDLEHLELGYAPPYGSAKDAVNMAGFAAANVLRGDCETVHAEELRSQGDIQLVDVRSPGEFTRGHLPKAINVPVDDIRTRMGELDKTRRVVVYCQVGYRGYLAYRVLKQAGFEVVNLDGGYKTATEGGSFGPGDVEM